MPGGYDLDPLPIHVPPRDDESTVSWLRRLSVRYDTPARNLLHGAGTVKSITNTTTVTRRLRNNRTLLRRLGLNDNEIGRLLAAAPLTSATLTYSETFGRHGAGSAVDAVLPALPGRAGPGPGRRRLPWCDTDLGTAPTIAAPPEQVAGQHLLHQWAAGSAEHATACGLPITHRLGFQALVELLDAHLSDTAQNLLDFDE